MINGTYEVKMKTPMGLKKGELVLNQYGNVLTGTMVILGKETPIENGETDGEHIRFSGELKTPVGKVAFDCVGTIKDGALNAEAKTKKGNFILTGTLK